MRKLEQPRSATAADISGYQTHFGRARVNAIAWVLLRFPRFLVGGGYVETKLRPAVNSAVWAIRANLTPFDSRVTAALTWTMIGQALSHYRIEAELGEG